jgi:hypothetical protein
MPTNPSKKVKSVTIDEVIIRLLGLKIGAELDEQTYFKLLKNKLFITRLGGKRLADEEDKLLRDELKSVKRRIDSTGGNRFKIKKGKTKVSAGPSKSSKSDLGNQRALIIPSGALTKIIKTILQKPDEDIGKTKVSAGPSKSSKSDLGNQRALIPSSGKIQKNKLFDDRVQFVTIKDITKKTEKKSQKPETGNFNTIKKTLDSILEILKSKFKFDQKQLETERKEKETEKRSKRESALEGFKKGISGIVSVTKKMLSPFQNIIDRVLRFVFFTLLGKAFTKFMEWMEDKGNQEKFNSFIEFLSSHWPALAGLYILFGTSFGKLVRGLLKGVARMTVALVMNIGKIKKFISKNKKLAFLGLAIAPLVSRELGNIFGENEETPESGLIPKDGADLSDAKKSIDDIKNTEVPKLNFGGMVPKFNIGGMIPSFKMGGMSPVGMGMDFSSGVPISGAGQDDTLIAAKTGEAILTEKDQQDIGQRYVDRSTGQPLNIPQYLVGRKPGKVSMGNLKFPGMVGGFFNGGMIPKFNVGGVVGGSSSQINLQLSDSQKNALEVLGKYESKSSGGYNAVNQIGINEGRGVSGFSGDFTKMKQHKGKSLTDLTLEEIVKLQHDDRTLSDQQWIDSGKLHAVGKYQIVGNTLPELIDKLNLPTSTKFSPVVQDAMALQLMKERGIQPWVGPRDKASPAERLIIENARKEKINISKSNPKLPSRVIDSRRIGNSVYTEREGGIYTRNGVPITKTQYTAQAKNSSPLNTIQKLISPIFGASSQASIQAPTINNPTKSNEQKLVEKRPWWDKAGWFGGASAIQKKQGGGVVVEESDGIKNPHSASDRRMFPIFGGGIVAVRPGEGIVTPDVIYNMGGEKVFNQFIASFDSGRDSNAAKMGYVPKNQPSIKPYSQNVMSGMITLPSMNASSSGIRPRSGGGGGSEVPAFSARHPNGMHYKYAEQYGLVG